MLSKHQVEGDSTPSLSIVSRQKDLRDVFSEQALQNKQKEDNNIKAVLRNAIDKATIHQALLRLIIHHDLPFSLVEWPELHTLIFALNSEAAKCIWTSHTTTARHLKETFELRQQQVAKILQQSQSLSTSQLTHGTHRIIRSFKRLRRTSLTLKASDRRP